MSNKQTDIIESIKSRLGETVQSVAEMKNNDVMIVVAKDNLVSAMRMLKTDEQLRFGVLMNHLGADYGDRMAVIYNLYSPLLRAKISVKTFLDRERPEVPSLEGLYRGISWYERETFDLLGIRFIGHSNLKRLLLPEDWTGHPLRKDYVYPESYHGLDTKREDLLDESAPGGGGHV